MRPNNKKITWVLGHRRLMSESESLIDYACEAGSPRQRAIAGRLTEQLPRYASWENIHSGLMKPVSFSATSHEQVFDLRATTLSLVHRGALFRYLEKRGIRGRERVRVVRCLHPHQDYAGALVKEHALHVRAEASAMCTRYIAYKMGDYLLSNLFREYSSAVDEYYAMYCECAVAESRGGHSVLEPLLCEKKAELGLLRDKILRQICDLAETGTWFTGTGLTAAPAKARKTSKPSRQAAWPVPAS